MKAGCRNCKVHLGQSHHGNNRKNRYPMVAKDCEEIHNRVQETAILARAANRHVNLHVTDWLATQQEDPSGFPTRKYKI